MSNQGLQVLYTQMNGRPDWLCERAYAPMKDMESALRSQGLPLYSLETFTPLRQFDVLGFSLQYEISYPEILTMLDLSGIPLRGEGRTLADPLVIAGGPCAQNPEPIAPFIDVIITGDGEPALPAVCDAWLDVRRAVLQGAEPLDGPRGSGSAKKRWPGSAHGCRLPMCRGSTNRSITTTDASVACGLCAAKRRRRSSPR